MIIYYASKFVREYKKLSPMIKQQAKEGEVIFRKDPFDPRLKTHKLSGRLSWAWSFSVNNDFRIIFEFHKKNVVWFHSVGDHSIYK